MIIDSLNLFGDVVSPEKEKKKTAPKKRPKSDSAYRTISEVATSMGVATHVLRFWETKFPQIKPVKRAGGRRYYRPEDIQLLDNIQNLLHKKGYTIRGVQALFKEKGTSTAQADSTSQGETSRLTVPDAFLKELKNIRNLID